MSSSTIAPLVQSFFVEHLLTHKRASPLTVHAYRDTFRLLLGYLQTQKGIPPASLCLNDLDAPLVLAFLDDLEEKRHNTVRSRNARLAAIRSFFRYAALREPESLAHVSRVLAIPRKRVDQRLVGYLTKQEIQAILSALDPSKWSGQRDHALVLTMYNTGARVSETCALKTSQLHLDGSPSIQLNGKGRKERAVPLWTRTARVIRAWLRRNETDSGSFVFPNARGGSLSRHGVSYILNQAAQRASSSCLTLKTKRVTPHIIRHSTAMHLLQAGVDISVIALWLGHESVETTHIYIEADLVMKERALRRIAPPGKQPYRFKPDDALLSFLSGL